VGAFSSVVSMATSRMRVGSAEVLLDPHSRPDLPTTPVPLLLDPACAARDVFTAW